MISGESEAGPKVATIFVSMRVRVYFKVHCRQPNRWQGCRVIIVSLC